MTLQDPKIQSYKNRLDDLKTFFKAKIGSKDFRELEAAEWLQWLIEWAEDRGRCAYADGDKGISPQTTLVFFKAFRVMLQSEFGFNFLEKFPESRKFPNQWQKYICRTKLYRRTQANYFGKDDVRAYFKIFEKIRLEGTPNQAYYAQMAKVIISISVLFAGCRVGALLDIRIGSVAFFSVDREGEIQTVVALFPGGSKSDLQSQRTSPIMFAQIKDEQICPMRAFIDWLKIRGIKRDGNGLLGSPSDFLFPVFGKNALLQTGLFSRKVKEMEKKSGKSLVPYRAHVGRFSITTLAMFAKDNKGDR